jgi:chitinase
VTIDVAGNPNTSATVANRRVDNTAPTAGLTDPGSPLRGTTVALNATGTDTGGSGVLNVKVQYTPTGGSTWTDICTDTTSPYSCSWNTTGVGDGGYDLRALTTDNAGNSTASSLVVNRVVDNTAPTGTNIQSSNGGATAGKAEQSDTITFTFSEQIAPASVLAGWNGSATNVTVRMVGSATNTTLTVWDNANTTQLPFSSSSVTLNGTYIQSGKTVNFATSSMVQSGSTITITLGTPDGPAPWRNTVVLAGQMSWPTSSTMTDVAGNPLTAGTVSESQPPNDVEF